jgi:hypothetical protein
VKCLFSDNECCLINKKFENNAFALVPLEILFSSERGMAGFHLGYTFGNYFRKPMPSSAKMRRVTFFSSYMGWNESFVTEKLHRPALSYIHFPCNPVVSYKDYHVAFGLASFGLGLVCFLGSLTV